MGLKTSIMSEKITIDKETAMRNFFTSYAGDISGELYYMGRDSLLDYLENDIFIGVASSATGIPENDFLEFAPEFFGV